MPPKKKQQTKNNKKGKEKGKKFGKIIFKPDTPQIVMELAEKIQTKVNLNGFRWNFTNQIFTNYKVDSMFKWFQQTSINHLELNDDNNPQILNSMLLKQVSPFMKLKVLKATNNMIDNIQNLQFLDAPNLQWIDFRQNRISSVSRYQKCLFPQLNMWRMTNNYISTLQPLIRSKIKSLYLLQANDNLLFDVSYLIKCCNTQLDYMYIQNSQIINGQKQKRILTKKLIIKHTRISSLNQSYSSNQDLSDRDYPQ